MTLKEQLNGQVKEAMRAKDKLRLSTIRMVMAAIKQREIDEKIEVSDQDIVEILTKLVKQRKDSEKQYLDAGRSDLAEKEKAEMDIISEFLPQELSEQEVLTLIANTIESSGASGMQDMGKVMALMKDDLTGRADMGKVSALVRKSLTA